MSQQCPQCSNPIEADFGVVTCSRCQSVLFIDMEGNVQLSANTESSQEAPSFENAPESLPEHSETFFSNSADSNESFQDGWMQDKDPAPIEGYESSQAQLPADSEVHPAEPMSMPMSEEEPRAESFSSNESEEPTIVRPARNISEVSDFSNSDQAFGPLSYSVMIEAIDTKEIRQQLAEALSDAKFQWDSKELLKQIKMGTLLLENINPVKASVLIHRLQGVPVKVSWTQNVYS